MSSSSTPTHGHAASAKKIANYTQSISTGVTNLLTEIGRVSAASVAAPAVTSGTDAAILLQLQALTGQIVGLTNRMDEVHRMVQRLEKRLDDMPSSPTESIWELTNKNHPYVSQGYNQLARLHNGRACHGSSMLLPLHNHNDRPILGFPSTVSQLINLDDQVREQLCKIFHLNTDKHQHLVEFIGVRPETIKRVTLLRLPPEKLALDRIKKTSEREAACRTAGPPTTNSRAAAEIHNKKARAHNKRLSGDFQLADHPLMPIHDSRNNPVAGFPKTYNELTRPGHQADILYFLCEYGQSGKLEKCLDRWIEFVGIDSERAMEDIKIQMLTWLE